jgi:hypothetical protein
MMPDPAVGLKNENRGGETGFLHGGCNTVQAALNQTRKTDYPGMDTFNTIKTSFLQVTDEFSSLLSTTQAIQGISPPPFDKWEETGRFIHDQMNEDTVKIAVVGAIKSGKSTFVNAFLGGDYLKRGAGVVTSIVTKIRKGPTLRASLFF